MQVTTAIFHICSEVKCEVGGPLDCKNNASCAVWGFKQIVFLKTSTNLFHLFPFYKNTVGMCSKASALYITLMVVF